MDCMASTDFFEGSTGSNEKRGSVPSLNRTCKAKERYSRFTAPAGSTVGARHRVLEPSWNFRQQSPRPTASHFSFLAGPMFLGIISGRQPISNSARRFTLRALASASLSLVCLRKSCWTICAMQSAWTRLSSFSLFVYAKSPMGSRQWQQRMTSSSSESSATSKSFAEASFKCLQPPFGRPAAPSLARASRAVFEKVPTGVSFSFSEAAVSSGKVPAPARPWSRGWNHNCGRPSASFTPTATNSRPQRSFTTCPWRNPPASRQASSRMSKRDKGGCSPKLPA
mmetsp:Transcript_89816/g.201021  ORF Transcript_89816/g.201021 Transcript_89816/m.201021 type:complete len:282 (-) Transcript_89816:47-892(-)